MSEISAPFISPLLWREQLCTTHQRGDLFLYHFTPYYNRSCMTPKGVSDFKVLVIYLSNTHVELEIQLSLPDNNAQNGAACMNHYLRPGVVLLMNMHEPREGACEVCTTCFLEEPQMVQLNVLSWSFQSQAQRLSPHPQLVQASRNTCSPVMGSARWQRGAHMVRKTLLLIHSWAMNLAEGQKAAEVEVGSECPSEMPAGESRKHEGCLLALPLGSRN